MKMIGGSPVMSLGIHAVKVLPNDSITISEVGKTGKEYSFKNLDPETKILMNIVELVTLTELLNDYFGSHNEPANYAPQIPLEHYDAVRTYNINYNNRSLVSSFAEQNKMFFSQQLDLFIRYNAHVIYGVFKETALLPTEIFLEILAKAAPDIKMYDNTPLQFIGINPVPEDSTGWDIAGSLQYYNDWEPFSR